MYYAICNPWYYCTCVLTLCTLLERLLSRCEENRKDLWVIISLYKMKRLHALPKPSKCKYCRTRTWKPVQEQDIVQPRRERGRCKRTMRILVSVCIFLLCCLKFTFNLADNGLSSYQKCTEFLFLKHWNIYFVPFLHTFLWLQLYEFLKLVSLNLFST